MFFPRINANWWWVRYKDRATRQLTRRSSVLRPLFFRNPRNSLRPAPLIAPSLLNSFPRRRRNKNSSRVGQRKASTRKWRRCNFRILWHRVPSSGRVISWSRSFTPTIYLPAVPFFSSPIFSTALSTLVFTSLFSLPLECASAFLLHFERGMSEKADLIKYGAAAGFSSILIMWRHGE